MYSSLLKTTVIKNEVGARMQLLTFETAGAYLASYLQRHFLLLSFVSDVSLRDGSCCQIWRMCFY